MPSAWPERSETLGPGGLHVDRGPQGGTHRSAIAVTWGASLGRSATTVQSALTGDQPAPAARSTAARRIPDAVGPRPRRIGVGEVAAQVAQPGRSEDGVGHGVGHGVGVAVSLESPDTVAGDRHPTQYLAAIDRPSPVPRCLVE